jgi:hypothetical protein
MKDESASFHSGPADWAAFEFMPLAMEEHRVGHM